LREERKAVKARQLETKMAIKGLAKKDSMETPPSTVEQDREGTKEVYYGYSREEMLHYIPAAAARVLDVGCARGNFGLLIKDRRNAEVWGIEIVQEAADIASKILDRVIHADVEQDGLDLPEKYFDCIVFNDVLEHLRDPWKVLKKCRKLLNEGGSVVSSIPNVMHISASLRLFLEKDWPYSDWGVLDRTHLRFFTAKSIRVMFEECGYSIELMRGMMPSKLHWKIVLLNYLVCHAHDEMKYLQYAVVARSEDNIPARERNRL
jgi:2-polyprenyl-3-methyl-5-hydroxy-6-metoxy-1,4-benzoquinol methylase